MRAPMIQPTAAKLSSAVDSSAQRGATLEDLAWMENVYSPPIGALYEPLSVAAQNGMAQL